jgi:RNA recognition motif-containing protein
MDIFIAHLSQNINNESLNSLFKPYGEVAWAKVIIDSRTGKSKCYGFVQMPDLIEAMEAISSLNNKVIEGRKVEVKHSKPNTPEEPAPVTKKTKKKRPDDEY